MYQMGSYISSNEAVWRMLAFSIHERHLADIQLAVHLENGQRVYFTPATAAQQVLAPKETTLMAFFKLCRTDAFARTLLYNQVPSYYTWTKTWNRRKRRVAVDGHPGVFKDPALTRVYTVHPTQEECYYMRMLLHEVCDPVSFEAVRTVAGRLAATYRDACKYGYFHCPQEWTVSLQLHWQSHA